ncbi:MAG: hypothetical protein QXG58_05510 [Candidatus Bathyarchaeia archaeon]
MNRERDGSHVLNFSLKFWKTFLILLVAVLAFAGPTYFVLFLWRGLDLSYAFSMVLGFLMFTIGLILLSLLIKKKVFS